MRRKQIGFALVSYLLLTAAPAASATTLFGLVDTGELFASDDDGATWAVRSTLPTPDAVGLLATTSSDTLYLATRSGTVYRSHDSGETWATRGTVPASDVEAMATGIGDAILLLTATGTVWESIDGGSTFTAIGSLTAPDCVSLTRAPSDTIYGLTRTGLVSQSPDGGGTWYVAGAVTTPDAVEIISLPSALYVLTGTGHVWRSTDAGQTWFAVAALSQVHMTGMVGDGVGGLCAATREGEVARSGDGEHWFWAGTINQLNVVALATNAPFGGVADAGGTVVSFSVGAPWPNPVVGFGRMVVFPITLSQGETVRLDLFDVRGRRVAERAPVHFSGAGVYPISWDVGDLSSGVYFARFVAESGGRATARVVVTR